MSMRELLSKVELLDTNFMFARRQPLVLVTPAGKVYRLSVQGSGTHYCEPRCTLETLTEYDSVEVAILDPSAEGEDRGFRQPSEIGLDLDNNPSDEVLGWVPVSRLVAALETFEGTVSL